MTGAKVPDGTLIWLDVDRKVHAHGPKAEEWRRHVWTQHLLPDYDAKEKFEREHPDCIAEPGSILRRVRTPVEVIDVLRKLCYIDDYFDERGKHGGLREYVQIPEDCRTAACRAESAYLYG